jgi:hypothetical protein
VNSSLVDFTQVASQIQSTLTSAVSAIVPVAVSLLGVFIGWRVVRRLIGR